MLLGCSAVCVFKCVAENKVRQQDEEEGRWGRAHSWNTECEDLGLLLV